jgi:DNA-binding response OmpR family regulator
VGTLEISTRKVVLIVDDDAARELGAFAYLTKPFNPGELEHWARFFLADPGPARTA